MNHHSEPPASTASEAAVWRRLIPFWMLPVLLTSSCMSIPPYRAYKDKGLSSNQVAVIVCQKITGSDRQGSLYRVVIDRVDGRLAHPWWWLAGQSRVSVLPGKHTLRLVTRTGGGWRSPSSPPAGSAKCTLWIMAEAGRTYTVRSEQVDARHIRMWLEDEHGRLVGGIQGGTDEPPDPEPTGAKK